MANISFHGSHNGAIVIEQNKEILCVVEIERFLNYKNVGIAQYKTPRYIMIVVEEILKWVEKEYGIKEFDNCYFSSTDFIGENFEGAIRGLGDGLKINQPIGEGDKRQPMPEMPDCCIL